MTRKLLHYFVVLATIVWSMGLPMFMPLVSRAATTTTVALTDMSSSGFMRLSQGGNFYAPVFQITIGSNENTKTLAAVTIAFTAANGTTPTWTQGAAASSELLDLATTNGGITLWKESNSTPNLQFDGTPDTQVTLAAGPVYSASNIFTLTPNSGSCAATCTLAENQIFYVALRPDSAGVTNGNAFVVTFPANGFTTTANPPTVTAVTTLPIVMENEAAGIRANGVSGAAGSNTINIRFTKPVQKVGGGALNVVDTPLTYVDGGGTAQTISSLTHTACQDFAVITMSGNLDVEDVDGTPATVAAGTNKIAACGSGEVLGTTAVGMSNPLNITTSTIPTATVGTVYNNASPLVSFAASGGTGPYTFAANSAADTTTLTNAGLALVNDGGIYKLTGTILNIPGNYGLNIKVTDSSGPPQIFTKFFNLNIATAGGVVPYLSQITPPGGAQGTSSLAVIITGSNTSFTTASAVEFLLNGVNDTNLTVSSKTSTSGTNLGFNLAIAVGAATGTRDVRVTSGTQVVTMPNGFNVFTTAGSGLNLLLPTDAATSVPLPPSFSFNPSSSGSVNSYRLTVRASSSPTVAALWNYIFPKPADAQNSNGSHCSSTNCNLTYGSGQFRILTQAAALSPNTTYYWQVKTYAETTFTFDAATSMALETTSIRSFSTTASVTDGSPPGIMHRPLFQAVASANLVIFARVMDNIATKDTTPALATTLKYCNTSNSCNPTTVVTSTYVGAGYYKYTITSANVPATGGSVRYFLEATDSSNTSTFKQPNNDPFTVTTIAAPGTPATITGTVKDSTATCATGVQTATVFADGSGFNATTDASCAYSLGGLPAGNYDLVAIKEGYGDRRIDSVPGGASNINFMLSSGFGGGFGGDTTKPRVKFTGPPSASMAPGNDANFKVFVAFDKTMSQTSVTTTGNLTVNEVIISTGGLTDITASKGAWTYYTTAPSLPSVPPEANMAVWGFSGANTFGDNKTIAVIVSANVTDTAGNPIQGNQSDGSYVFSFTTSKSADFTGFNTTTGQFAGGGTFGSGAFVPPHVTGTTPPPGQYDVPVNTKLVVNFSEPMANDGGSYLLKTYIKLYTVSGTSETDVSASAIDTVTLSTDKRNATINLNSAYNSGKFATSTTYRLKVLGGAKAASGITLMPPGQETSVMFVLDFKTGSSAAGDTAAPSVAGSYPNTGDTAVPTTLNAVSIGFNKDMDASTLTTSTVYLSIGSSAVNGTVDYRPLERMVYFIPQSALTANTTYTINVTTGVRALNGVALAGAVTRTFTTGAADTTAPTVAFVNADDYNLAVTFFKPMNAAKVTDTLNYAASVLKPANLALKYGTSGFDGVAGGTAITVPATAEFNYDSVTSTLMIRGYHSEAVAAAELLGKEILVTLTGVKDTSGVAISTSSGANTGRAPIANSSTTKGALGPMAMKESAFTMGGDFRPDNFDAATFGFAPPVEVRPFNMMAGQSTIYGVRLPIAQQIPAGGTIMLTFPTGFDVAAAQQDINSPMRGDLNGPGSGTIKFKCQTSVTNGKTCSGNDTLVGDASGDTASKGGLADDGIIVNATARTVTVYLSAATNSEGHDFLTIDISGIRNSTVPKDFNTSGYTVDIKTKNAATVLESLTSMPFFIQAGGSYSVSGTITATGNNQSGTMKVYLHSPMTGPLEVTSANFAGGATAAYSFTNLPAGDYMLFTDQVVTIGSAEFTGKTIPEAVRLSGNTTYNFTISSNTSGGTAVTINIDGPSAEPLDIFAGSPTGFKAKQVTLDSTAGAQAFTIDLADGEWFVGVGPQMPKGFASGPPPAPSYLPPKPKNVKVTNPTCNVEGVVGCALTFTLTSATKTIKGVVKDGANKVIANAEVYGYSPTGGFGTHAQADSAGAFTLNVVDGSYVVGAFIPGMPPSKEVPVVVTSHATTYLLIDGVTTAITPATAASSFILKVAKPDYTISGKVTDGTNVVQGASVYTYRNDGPGHANANTDSAGNYTLYVGNGTWKVGAFLPQYGNLSELTVTVNGANATNQNFSPTTTGTFYNVSGTVTSGGTPVQGAFVKLSGNNTFNEAITTATGTYSFKVPAGNNYVIRAFIPGVGESAPLPTFNVSADVTGKNIIVAAPRTITITFSASVSKAFVDMFSSTGLGNHIDVTNATSGTMQLPDGSYTVRVDIPGTSIGLTDIAATTGETIYSNTTGVVTVNGNEGLTVTLPPRRTITGTVTDGTNNLADAWVELVSHTTGVHFGTKTATNGSFSLPAADGSYMINAMKPGYFGQAAALTVNASTGVQTITLSSATTTIAGQVLVGSSGASNAFVRAEKQGGGFSGTQADTNGIYTLYVTSGIWRVYAVAEGYAETAYASNPIDVSGGSVSGKNITLTSTVTLRAPKSKPITPASGGTLEDTTAGVKLTIPANALGSSTSAGNLQAKETNNVRETSSARPLGGKAKDIKATDSSGTPITTLSSSVTVEMSYTKAELAAVASATDSSINTMAETDALKMAYWDETTANWVTKPTTVTYKNASGNVITDATTIDTASEFDTNVATVTIAAATDHFSLYAPVVATNAAAPSTPAGLAATVVGTAQINLSWTQVSGATSYDIYRSTSLSGTYSRLGSEPTVSSGSTTTYNDTGLTSSTTYYYKITSLNTSGESAASSAVNATTNMAIGSSGSNSSYDITPPTNLALVIAAGASQTTSRTVTLTIGALDAAQMMLANSDSFIGATWETYTTSKTWTLSDSDGVKTVYAKFKDASGNVSAVVSDTITLRATETTTVTPPPAAPETVVAQRVKHLEKILDEASAIFTATPEQIAEKINQARDEALEKRYESTIVARIVTASTPAATKAKVLTFVTYGTTTTLALGAGERAGVVNSFRAAFAKEPTADADWEDIIKIANGRWPGRLNPTRESQVAAAFKKVYLRTADRSNVHDDAAITIMAYGLRSATRNPSSEKAAIKSFKAIFGKTPVSASDWDTVRAIAYSGAKR